jgi:hypothetical protein
VVLWKEMLHQRNGSIAILTMLAFVLQDRTHRSFSLA